MTQSRYCEAADFISTHQVQGAVDIGWEVGGRPAFDPHLGHLMRSDPAKQWSKSNANPSA
jgi:hypothetical protein